LKLKVCVPGRNPSPTLFVQMVESLECEIFTGMDKKLFMENSETSPAQPGKGMITNMNARKMLKFCIVSHSEISVLNKNFA
jgi:hypothetical protein